MKSHQTLSRALYIILFLSFISSGFSQRIPIGFGQILQTPGSPQEAQIGITYTYTYDYPMQLGSYWTINGLNVGEGSQISHQYYSTGNYTVSLRAPSGEITATLIVTVVGNPVPTPSKPQIYEVNCGNTVLKRGNPPIGVTWFWQTSQWNTSTSNSSKYYTKTNNGRIYLRARDRFGSWSDPVASNYISIKEKPIKYNVMGGFKLCEPSDDPRLIGIRLSDSEYFTEYQLQKNGQDFGTPVQGNGNGIYFLPYDRQWETGIYTVIATNLSNGCTEVMNGSAVVDMDGPEVFQVTGGGNLCDNSSHNIGLSDTEKGVTYKLMKSGVVLSTKSGSGSAINFGSYSTEGIYTVEASQGTSEFCISQMDGEAIIESQNPGMPLAPTISSNTCGSKTITFTLFPGQSLPYWQGTNPNGTSTSNTSLIQEVSSSGTYYVRARSSEGCWSPSRAIEVVVNLPPNIYEITGSDSYCSGETGVEVGLFDSENDVSYQLRLNGSSIGAPVNGTGNAISFGHQTVAGTYSVEATNTTSGCVKSMGSKEISVYQLPLAFEVTGGGSYCENGEGIQIELSGSENHIEYQLMLDDSPIGEGILGNGSTINFGNQNEAGEYTVTATHINTGCSTEMNGSQTININSAPTPFSVTGGGSYCNGGAGVPIGLDGSDTGIEYQLKVNGSPIGSPISGNGSALDFGLQTQEGSYTVTALNNITSCSNEMYGSKDIGINPLPLEYSITGGGNNCSDGDGVFIGLSNSESGVDYQLRLNDSNVGSPISGTGSPIDFGYQTVSGTYTIHAVRILTGCGLEMNGSQVVSIDPIPSLFNITGGGIYCSGSNGISVGLDGSETGVEYQLVVDGASIGSPILGTGIELDFGLQTDVGTYTINAKNSTTNCSSEMQGEAIVEIGTATPSIFNIGDGGSICEGDDGILITLSDSENNVEYQLMNNGQPVGSPINGYGGYLGFGKHDETGEYTIIATHVLSGCSQLMSGTAIVEVHQPSTPQFSILYDFDKVTLTREEPIDGSSWFWVPSPYHELQSDNSLSKTINAPNTSLYLRSLKNGCWGEAVEYTFNAHEPAQVTAKFVYNNTIEISWSGFYGNESGFIVKRATSETGYTTIYSGAEESFTDTNIDLGETYHYRVQSMVEGQISLSSSAKVVTAPSLIASPKPYSFASRNTKIEIQSPGNIPEISDVDNAINIIGSSSGIISGQWNLNGDILEFTPAGSLTIGEQITVYVRPEIAIEGTSNQYISEPYEWTFNVSADNSADDPINFSLRQMIRPNNWPVEPSSLAIDLNNNGTPGVFVFSYPSYYIEYNGIDFEEVPIVFPEIQDPNLFPTPKIVGHLDADHDGDMDLIFKRGTNTFPPTGDQLIILENDNLSFNTILHEVSLGSNLYASSVLHDVDKDGVQDIIIGCYAPGASNEKFVDVYLSSDNYTSPMSNNITSTCSGCQIELMNLMDKEIDGGFEIVVGNKIYSINQDGTLSFQNDHPIGFIGSFITDINGDHLPDFVGHRNSNLVTYLNSSYEFDSSESIYSSSNGTPFFVGDFSGLSNPEILILDSEETVYFQNPIGEGPNIEGNNQWWTLSNWGSNHLMDFDLDGDMDIISFDGGGLYWYENSSSETQINQLNFEIPQSSITIDPASQSILIELNDISVDLSSVTTIFDISPGALFVLNSETIVSGESVKLYDINQLKIIAEDQKTTSTWNIKITRPSFNLVVNNQYELISGNQSIAVEFTEKPDLSSLNLNVRVKGKLAGNVSGEWIAGGFDEEAIFTPQVPFEIADEITISLPASITNDSQTKVLEPGIIKKLIASGSSYKDPAEFSSVRNLNSNSTFGVQVPFDIDYDGDLDIITHKWSGHEVYVNTYEGGTFSSAQLYLETAFSGIQEVYVPSDFDGDGSVDFLLRNSAKELFVSGFGNLPKKTTRGSVQIEDINGDGVEDIIYINGGSIEVVSLNQDTDSHRFTSLLGSRSIANFDIYDIDSDGDLDIIFAYSGFRTLDAFINHGQDGFEITSLNISCDDVYSISYLKLGDFNFDNETDYLISNGNAYLLMKNGDNYESTSVGNSMFLVTGDVSGNGVTELMNTPTDRYQLGNTVTHINQMQPISAGSFFSTYLADLDRDGDLDIITPSGWHENFSHQARFTSFELENQIGESTISASGHITVLVDLNADIQSLVSTFTTSTGVSSVKIGNIDQVSGVNVNDFSNEVIYNIIAEDGYTNQQWFVTVNVPSFRVVSVSPSSNQIGVDGNTPITIVFDDAPDPSLLNSIRVEGDKSGLFDGTWSISQEFATFSADRSFLSGEKITVRVPSNTILNQTSDKILKYGYEFSFISAVGASENTVSYFEEKPISNSISGPVNQILSHDLNGDTYLDLVIASENTVHVLINNFDGTFDEYQEILPIQIKNAVITDWDNNYSPNILLLSDGSFLYDLEFNGVAITQNPTHNIYNYAESSQLDLIDWGQNGTIDLIYNSRYVLLNDLSSTQSIVLPNSFNHKDAEVYSLNGQATILGSDSEPFLSPYDESVLHNYSPGLNEELNSFTIYGRRVDPFSLPVFTNTYHATELARVAYFTSDSDPDYFFRDLSEENQIINPDSTFTWINNPFSNLEQDISSNVLSDITNFKEFEIRDINGDQLQDIVFVYNETLSWFESTDGAFNEHIISTSLESPRNIELSDLDGDGDTDLILSAIINGERKLLLYENTIPPTQQSIMIETLQSDKGEVLSKEDLITEITLYPNPANAEFHLIGNIGGAVIHIYDLNGKEVLHETNDQDTSLNLNSSTLDDGIYLMRIELASGEVEERKLVIKH
ncbi:FG-GAP-like repeat-containing protein [Ekhidna sp.]|uniref:FG-GAP-like repeat-containing protein n=1 Tax=Ekhidna sp. TaxID=2608089 RepID=UPI003B5AD69B